ncbi:DUF72 domain-containing protein [Aureimonas glaciei]|uniref:DUF72 domain-containing protein n=1 Tax=Aureimonas glaciei TaxID=1776957 RepID=UPI001667688F|nr:DUF72 domain-containing protein [Aureimonas glaciei]
MPVRVGTAGWSISAVARDQFPAAGTLLERYAQRLSIVEINTSFYRPHRRTTYERWSACVPPDFRFSVKLPKAITHERRLLHCSDLIERFAAESGGLAEKLGAVLVQLPPSFAFPGDLAERFFEDLTAATGARVVVEPRHASWFSAKVEAMLIRQQVARVAADPPLHGSGGQPGGWPKLAYFRLHGTPRIYASPYDQPSLARHAANVASLAMGGAAVWTIFDNTMHGAAVENALQLRGLTS